jgi:multidrug efflux pump subunit AcrA (membrane-fusion protein)
MGRPGIFVRLGLPLVAAGLFAFALLSVLTQPPRTGADPVLPVPATPFAASVAGVGVIEPRSEAIAIASHLPGVVSKVYVQAGDAVPMGAPLFALDDRAVRAELVYAEAQIKSAEVALADARDVSQRAQESYKRQATSDAEATRRRFAVSLAETRLSEARAARDRLATELERLTVTAPIDARVWRVDVRPGEYAPAGPSARPLVVLGDDSELHVRVEVDQTDAARVRAEARAVANLRGDARSKAKLRFVRFEPLVQPKRVLTGDGTERVDTRTLEVIYAIEPGALRPFVGQQMDVFIEAEPTGIEAIGAPGAEASTAGS